MQGFQVLQRTPCAAPCCTVLHRASAQKLSLSLSTRLAAHAAGAQEANPAHISSQAYISSSSTCQPDPYVEAAYRLQSLITGVGDGEDELYYNMLLEEEPAHKLQVNAVLGAIVLTASTAICCLCGKDPAGGASLSWHSLLAALTGAAAAVPLVAYKHLSWSREAHLEYPTISALHKALVDCTKPWLTGMSRRQLAVHVLLDTLPVLFLMLPAAQAGLTSSFAWTSDAIGRSTGLGLPEEVGFVLALFMTALVSGAVKSTELMADPEQVLAVGDAVANADRYYRLTAAGSNQEVEAARAARAFKAIAISWREQEQQVASLFVVLQMMDFMYLGVLWYFTQDMTAPCVAALLANAVDYHNMWRHMQQGGGGTGSNGRGGNKKQTQAGSSRSSTQRE